VITTEVWTICIRANKTVKIGCQDHSLTNWLAFTDFEISRMDNKASKFWKKWKPFIEAIINNADL
jgi:hypothetical protein